MVSGKLKTTMDFSPLKAFAIQSPEMFETALSRGALQFLTWCNTGSVRTSRKPPIRWGVLRGSSSAFVGKKLVGVYDQKIKSGAPDSPSPLESYNGANLVATFIYNTEYAHKMHEWKGGWGEFTLQDGDAGDKWLEEHLKLDKDDIMEMVAIEFKKESGM